MAQEQLYSKKTETQDSEFGKDALKQLEKVKSAKIQKRVTRTIQVKVKCSTCHPFHDGWYHKHEIEVPEDSPIQDGDYIHIKENWGNRNYGHWG